MEDLEKKLQEKTLELYHASKGVEKINEEIREIQQQIDLEKFKSIPECDHDYYAVRGGACDYGMVVHGKVICRHPYCGSK